MHTKTGVHLFELIQLYTKLDGKMEISCAHKSIRMYNYTCLHLLKSPASTLRASMTMVPAMTALVVAMAGTIFPAMAVFGAVTERERKHKPMDCI